MARGVEVQIKLLRWFERIAFTASAPILFYVVYGIGAFSAGSAPLHRRSIARAMSR
jgi:hypothetical protein